MTAEGATKILYFAWLRERVGLEEEYVDLPPELTDIDSLLDWLATRGEGYAHALENKDVVRVALDMKHKPHTTTLGNPREIALFPPMTGG